MLKVLSACVVVTVCAASQAPLALWDASLLLQSKQRLQSSRPNPLRPALANLLQWADHWQAEADNNRTFSVLTKASLPPSGNPRHFLSIGT